MTSSANESSPAGIASPSAFAVLRLITNSNLVDWMTGRSAGFSAGSPPDLTKPGVGLFPLSLGGPARHGLPRTVLSRGFTIVRLLSQFGARSPLARSQTAAGERLLILW